MAAQTTYSGGHGIYYWMPGIAVNNATRTAVPFLHSSASTYLSSSWTLTSDSSLSFAPAQPLTTGTCSQTFLYPGDLISRTGDYMGAQTNPNDQVSFWLAGERATHGGVCQSSSELWDSRIIQVTP